jgi:hypothetical protein
MALLIPKNHSAAEKFLTLQLAKSLKPLPLLMGPLLIERSLQQLKPLHHGVIAL